LGQAAAPEKKYSVVTITSVVTFYWIVSISIVFLNKLIFRYPHA